MDLLVDVRHDDRGTTVKVGGELDLWSGRRLLECALDALHGHCPQVVIDLGDVTFMDCGGIRVLLAIRSRARGLGGSLSVGAVSAPVRRILEITEMDKLLEVPDSVRSFNSCFIDTDPPAPRRTELAGRWWLATGTPTAGRG